MCGKILGCHWLGVLLVPSALECSDWEVAERDVSCIMGSLCHFSRAHLVSFIVNVESSTPVELNVWGGMARVD